MAVYINGFGKNLLAEHSEFGLRILRVEYYDGERKVGQLAADPKKAWQSDTFLYHFRALSRGPHVLRASVIALAPDVPTGSPAGEDATVTIVSKPMQVKNRKVLLSWIGAAAKRRS